MPTGVEFEEDKFAIKPNISQPGAFTGYTPPAVAAYYADTKQPKMVNWLINHGWAKSPKGAHIILIAVVVINIAITLAVVKYFI